jgi:hypothetical protein
VGFGPEIVEIQLVDEALDRERDLTALVHGTDAVGHADEVDTLEAEAMVQTQDLGEIPREAGDVLDEDQIERRRDLERRGDEGAVTRPVLDAEARERRVLESSDHRPALAFGERLTEPDLVEDRAGRLKVAGVPCVDRATLHA